MSSSTNTNISLTSDGGGSFEEITICADGSPAIRRVENGVITFIGDDGVAITPTAWVPGDCSASSGSGGGSDDECLQDDNGIFWRRSTTDENGDITVSFIDTAGADYVPVGNVESCDGDDPIVQDTLACWNDETYIRRTTWANNQITEIYIDADGSIQNQPAGGEATLGPCITESATQVSELVCVLDPNEGPETRQQVRTFDATGVLQSTRYYDENDNEITLGAGFLVTYGPCVDVASDRPEYVTSVFDVTAASQFTPDGDMIGWTVRNRDATTATVVVNSGAILPLDIDESMSAGGVDEENALLNDTIEIDPGDGTIRVTITRRIT